MMPRRTYLIEQAKKARRLAATVGCVRASADLQAYACGCDDELRALNEQAGQDGKSA